MSSLYEFDTEVSAGSGNFVYGYAGEALGVHALVYMAADGTWRLADADSAVTMPALGITMDAAALGGEARILQKGYIESSTWAWTVAATLYASTTAGELTQTAPTGAGDVIQTVGIPITATMIYFSPSLEEEETGCLTGSWPCNSKGNSFTTVQAAVTDLAGDGWVYVPAGTWSEAVTITNDNVHLFGTGWSSIINGGTTGHAIHITGDSCIIRNVTVQTTQGGGNAFYPVYIESCDDARIEGVHSASSDGQGIEVNSTADQVHIFNCLIENTDNHGIVAGGPNMRIVDNKIKDAADYGIYMAQFGDDTVTVANKIDTTGDDGIYIHTACENCIVDGNRITNWTNECIDDDSGTSVVGDNDCT